MWYFYEILNVALQSEIVNLDNKKIYTFLLICWICKTFNGILDFFFILKDGHQVYERSDLVASNKTPDEGTVTFESHMT